MTEASLAARLGKPEGHRIEFDEDHRVNAMTLVNFKWLIEREGESNITWPDGRSLTTHRLTY